MAGPEPAMYASAVTVAGFVCLALSATAVGRAIWGHFEYLAGGWDSERGYFGPFRTCKRLNYGREVCGDFNFRPHGIIVMLRHFVVFYSNLLKCTRCWIRPLPYEVTPIFRMEAFKIDFFWNSITLKPINNVVQSNVVNTFACVQCVQYHRKLRWVPQARSKIFRVPERRKQNDDEKTELLRLHNHYKTQVRAVRTYLLRQTEQDRVTSTADHIIVTPEEEAAEMQQCIELNNAWNTSIAEIRNKRLAQAMDERQEYILTRLELKREREEEALRAAEEMVRLEKARSKTFILKENLDQAIEYALAHPVDYDFAITLEGEILNGRISSDDKVNQSATASN